MVNPSDGGIFKGLLDVPSHAAKDIIENIGKGWPENNPEGHNQYGSGGGAGGGEGGGSNTPKPKAIKVTTHRGEEVVVAATPRKDGGFDIAVEGSPIGSVRPGRGHGDPITTRSGVRAGEVAGAQGWLGYDKSGLRLWSRAVPRNKAISFLVDHSKEK